MQVSQRLVRASRIMACVSITASILAPLGTIVLFFFPDQTKLVVGEFSITAHYARLLTDSVPFFLRLGALACAMVPTGIAVWGLLALTRLFRLFAGGEVFSPETLRALSQITAALFWNVLAALLTEPPITYFLTRANPGGHRYVSIGIGSDDVQLLFLAGVAFVIARAMAEARRVADENASFV